MTRVQKALEQNKNLNIYIELNFHMKGSKRRAKRALVSLIILNYNGKADTLEFLKSIKKTDYPNYEIIVVDNASTDGSVAAIRKKFPKVKIVQNKENLGFSAGMNPGIRKSKGKYVVIMDNDRYVFQKEWLSHLVDAVESDQKIGMVIPMLLYYRTNTIQLVGQVAPLSAKITSATYLLGLEEEDKDQFSKIFDIVAGNGLIKKEVLKKIGLFDEKMRRYFDETDLCYRARAAGYRVVAQPKSKMWHKGSATINARSYFSIYENYKNKIRYILKNYGPFTKPLAIGFNFFYYIYLIMFFALTNRPRLSKAMIDGVVWNCKNWKDYV